MDWISVGYHTEILLEDLALEELQTYYICVEAINVVGLSMFACTDGIMVSIVFHLDIYCADLLTGLLSRETVFL